MSVRILALDGSEVNVGGYFVTRSSGLRKWLDTQCCHVHNSPQRRTLEVGLEHKEIVQFMAPHDQDTVFSRVLLEIIRDLDIPATSEQINQIASMSSTN